VFLVALNFLAMDGSILGAESPAGDSANIEDETQQMADNLEQNMTSRIFNAVFIPTNPFIIISIPAVSVMLCQTAWIGGTYIPLPPPGKYITLKVYNSFDMMFVLSFGRAMQGLKF
jgi:hypothetical protein